MNPFTALSKLIEALTHGIVTMATTVDKAVGLIETEVDVLAVEQNKRIIDIEDDINKLREKRKLLLSSPKEATKAE